MVVILATMCINKHTNFVAI